MLKKYNLNLNQSLDLKQRICDKKVIYNVILVILIVFWDTVIPSIGHFLPAIGHVLYAIGHVLYLALEVINTIIEHFLEHSFHMSPRESEMMVFWGGMIIDFVLLSYFLRKAYLKTIALFEDAKIRWRMMEENQKKAFYIKVAVVISMLVVPFFF
jgi:hypothetical protein